MITQQEVQRSSEEYRRAQEVLADTPAIMAEMRPSAPCIARAEGSRLWDVDGNCYVDYLMGMGPLLLGHSPKVVLDAVRKQLEDGIGYGKAHRLHVDVAEAICRTVPSAERCVISNTGSEAVHVATRIARAATGRRRIIKFSGHYHGWLDPIFVGVPKFGTSGQDPAAIESVTVCEWNDVPALEAVMGDDVAAVIMEPITANGGCIKPAPGYLEAVRELTNRLGAMLIFDETVTGYRVALGGAQQYLGVLPDLTVLGKALGGGFPISAVCGPASSFDEVASSKVLHMGTYNANVVSAAAAIATVNSLEDDSGFYERLDERTSRLVSVISRAAASEGVSLAINSMPGFLYVFLSERPIENCTAAGEARMHYSDFSSVLLANGIHAPSLGVMYVTNEHGEEELEATAEAFRAAARSVR